MASATPLCEANTQFCVDLFQKLNEGNKSCNIFYSPLSISTALAMVLLGARGNTEAQMNKALVLSKCDGDVHTQFSKLIADLNKPDAQYSLSIANRLYGEKSFSFVKEFLDKTLEHYEAQLEAVDFGNNAEAERIKINGWVQEKTKEKIKNLLPEGTVDGRTKLVLVNAIYFKGNWNKEFMEYMTRNALFRVNKNESKPVKMMYQKNKFPFSHIPELEGKVLEMPYVGKELSMLIFLPDNIEDNTTGLEKMMSQMTYENLMKWTRPDMMDCVDVEVGLPRFKMEHMIDMNEVLSSMGMSDLFIKGICDLSGVSGDRELFVSKVVHKAFVEVNEEGTEAAGATSYRSSYRRGCSQVIQRFIADHPFLFFIRHNPSISILFAGRYCSPE